MTECACSRAFANIALCKYWGKLGPGNAPATPSISLALEQLWVEYTAEWAESKRDRFIVDGQPPDVQTAQRLRTFLAAWRTAGFNPAPLSLTSRSSFPRQAGLASSAAAYAALVGAISGLANTRLSQRALSRWARLGSGSAARSIVGGLAALPAGIDPYARLLAPAADVPWGMVVVQVQASKKVVSSRIGMELSRVKSPFYQAWVKQAAADYRLMLSALKSWNLTVVGGLMEANTLAMHACMMATRPGLIYWAPATLALFKAAASWRERGVPTYATADAGAHVVFLAQREDLRRVARLAAKVAGVIKVIPSLPGGSVQVTLH